MKLSKKLLATYIVLLILFTTSIIAAFTIPTSFIRKNVIESAIQIKEEGLWFKPFGLFLFQIDNMTDCLMMNISVSADENNTIKAAMTAEFAQPSNGGIMYHEMANTTLMAAEKGRQAATEHDEYSRYWHGYQIILRPLLCIFNYKQIRIINYIIFTSLFSIVIILLYRNAGKVASLSFLAAMFATNIFIIPLALQFSTCFYIAFLSMIVLLSRPDITKDKNKSAVTFFTIGAVTSFMDFLTTPILTLGLPLAAAMMADNKGKDTPIRNIAANSMAWLGGYASLWASKWIVASIVTGENMVAGALANAQYRIGDTIVFGGNLMSFGQFLSKITESQQYKSLFALLILAAAAAVTATAVLLYRKRAYLKSYGWLLVIAAMPALWFAVLKNHSIQHIFYTWRDWILTIWCVITFICNTCKKPATKWT